MIVTFYSFKGGVGRSMAVANVGDILARRGFRVLLIDFDLEAPGLEQYFQINHSAARRQEGLLDLLITYKRSMSVAAAHGEDQFKRVDRFIFRVYEQLRDGGRLDLIPAGQREGREHLDRYAANLRTFDWQDFYNRWEGELFFEWLRGALVPELYDLVLVDSRTGVTEMGGICTYQLADAIFMLSAANHQNRQGTLNVAADFQSPPVQAVRRQRPLEILAVPARVEQRDPALAGPFLENFTELFARYLPPRVRDAGLGFGELLIPYEPAYAFEERVISDPTRTAERQRIAGAFERLADAVCALVPDAAAASERARTYTRQGSAPQAPTPIQFDVAKRHAGYDVFLSYAAGDAAAARELAGLLRRAGLIVFEDRLQIAAGKDWRARTGQALFHSRACLVCCGSEGLSEFQANDLMAVVREAAAGRELAIVPVFLPGANVEAFRALMPADLQARLPLDLHDGFESEASTRQLDLFVSSLKVARTVPPVGTPPAASESTLSATTEFGAPYPGPRPFGEADVQFFFGRENTRNQLRDALQRHRLVVLTGPSASGKTSLVEAGLVPLLRADKTPLAYDRLVPGERPDEELRDALSRVQAQPQHRMLLFLDQLERLLRLPSAERARAFLARVGEIVADPNGPAIVIALRDVRLSALAALAPAGLLDEARRLPIPPLTDRELRSAVLRPAELAGLAFEPGLVDRVVADWGLDQRFLPFLQRVLHELWLRRREGFLTNDAYTAIPDPVEQIAEHAWVTLDDRLKPIAERVIPRIITLCGNLTTLDAGCRPADLVLSGMEEISLRAMLWHLVDHSLLYAYLDANREARLAPAFVVEQWDRAQAWVNGQADFLDWLASLEIHRRDWDRTGRDPKALLAGRILDQALEKRGASTPNLSKAEVEFIGLSEAVQQSQRRRRYQVAAAVALVMLLVIGSAVWTQRQEAETRNAITALVDEGDRAAAAGDRQTAVDAYTKALELDADNLTALMRRATMSDALGLYDVAIGDLDRVIALTGNQEVGDTTALRVEAYLARGLVHQHRQDSKAALTDFDTVLALDGTNAVAHASRGSVLDQLKQDGEAVKAYSRAVELDPDYADARFARGVIYQRQNRLSDAVNDFTRVAALPSASSATQLAARSRLEQLGKGGNVNAQRPQRSSVTLNISSASDRDAADTVAKVLDPNTFDVQVSERPSQSSRGDVRFYFREDERAAEQVRQAVESVIAERGYNVRLELRFLSTKDPVARGTIEVWLPPLTVLALPVQQYARPSLSRK